MSEPKVYHFKRNHEGKIRNSFEKLWQPSASVTEKRSAKGVRNARTRVRCKKKRAAAMKKGMMHARMQGVSMVASRPDPELVLAFFSGGRLPRASARRGLLSSEINFTHAFFFPRAQVSYLFDFPMRQILSFRPKFRKFLCHDPWETHPGAI